MKIDFDSILYIVITIVILVISALGSRRKRNLQQQQMPGTPGSETDVLESRDTVQPASGTLESRKSKGASQWEESPGPFERLEQILSGQEPEYESPEGESLETIVDEEEQILEEISKRRQEEESKSTPGKPAEETIAVERRGKRGLPDLFGNVNEIKKAVIYSEILNRKYE